MIFIKIWKIFEKMQKSPARAGFELATFGFTQNLNSQNPLSHGVSKILVTLVEMDYIYVFCVFLREKSESELKKIRTPLKKYFIIKKWFFRPKKVKISRFFVENRQNNTKNSVFRQYVIVHFHERDF